MSDQFEPTPDEEPEEEKIVRTLVQCENVDNCRKWGSPPDHCSHARQHLRGENCFEPCPHGGYCEPAPGVVQVRYEREEKT